MDTLHATILIVDDRPANLLAVEAILAPLGHRILRASSGEEALKHVLRDDPAVILMDVQMPGLDGFQTVRLIKERPKSAHIPVIFLTAINKDPAYVFKGYEFGAVDYLLKPFDPAVLRAKVSVFVELWRRGELLKRQEAELRRIDREKLERQNQLRYKSMIDSLPQSVWATNAEGHVYMWNQAWAEYCGFERELTPDEYHQLLHADDRERVVKEWRTAVRTGIAFETQYRLRRYDGEYRWHLARATPERDERGQLLGWIATATDVDELRRAREEAQAASRTKDEFLATVSHELRNPLNAILGWMRLLRSGRLDEQKRDRALATIERNTEAQLALVEDILDVSRIITGKMRIVLRPVILSQVIAAAVDTVRPAAEQKGIRLEVSCDASADHASGDPDRLQQVVWNLLANAIKFTPRGGRVEVALTRDDSYVHIRVTDSGRGITADFLPHVFERFRQAETVSTRIHGGLGLGLAIVRHVVESHGGSVSVDSPGEGQGATFLVQLPLRAVVGATDSTEREAPAPRAPLSLAEAPALDGLKVLVVDDEPDARELLALVLGESGAEVTAVGSAEEALEQLRSLERLDVMVSDVGLPRMDGYALIRQVRAIEGARGRVPAAALTGFARAEDGRRALEEGFQVHVPKPVEPALLVSLVARLAGREENVTQAAIA